MLVKTGAGAEVEEAVAVEEVEVVDDEAGVENSEVVDVNAAVRVSIHTLTDVIDTE
jgi:hypothetical protein